MISEILTSNVVNITELKRTPVELANHKETCVLNNGKPCFYTVSTERMAELLEAEKRNNELNALIVDIYTEVLRAEQELKQNGVKGLVPMILDSVLSSMVCLFNEVKAK